MSPGGPLAAARPARYASHAEPVSVRPAEAADRGPVVALCRAANQSLALTDPDLDDFLPRYWDWWRSNPYVLLAVAEQAGRPVGFAASLLVSAEEGYIQVLQSTPDAPARRVRLPLLAYTLGWLRARGRPTVRWTSAQENGLYAAVLERLTRPWSQPVGRFVCWTAAPAWRAQGPLPTAYEEHLDELRARWAAADRSGALWAPGWFWRALRWVDVEAHVRAGEAILHLDGHALLCRHRHSWMLAWCEGTPEAVHALARAARAWPGRFGPKLWALLPAVPTLAAPLAEAGFRPVRAYRVWEVALDSTAFDTLRRQAWED